MLKEHYAETEIVYCKARLTSEFPLCDGNEDLHIITNKENIEASLRLPGTKVIMKCAGQMPEIKERLLELEAESDRAGRTISVYGVEECLNEGERLYSGVRQLPENGKYMMTVIVKERRQNDTQRSAQ